MPFVWGLGDMTTPEERRRSYQAEYQRKRRAAAKAAGTPIPHSGPSGPSGKSGGKATAAERQRRWRERERQKKLADPDDSC